MVWYNEQRQPYQPSNIMMISNKSNQKKVALLKRKKNDRRRIEESYMFGRRIVMLVTSGKDSKKY
jgi:hypothetical protein